MTTTPKTIHAVGDKIRAAMKSRGLTSIPRLAMNAGVGRSTVGHLLNRRRPYYRIGRAVAKVCAYLNVDLTKYARNGKHTSRKVRHTSRMALTPRRLTTPSLVLYDTRTGMIYVA